MILGLKGNQPMNKLSSTRDIMHMKRKNTNPAKYVFLYLSSELMLIIASIELRKVLNKDFHSFLSSLITFKLKPKASNMMTSIGNILIDSKRIFLNMIAKIPTYGSLSINIIMRHQFMMSKNGPNPSPKSNWN